MVSAEQSGPQFLADQLQRLMALPLSTKTDVQRWYSEAEAVQSEFKRFPPFEFPHHIWHYFSDADIRQRDLEYRDSQHRKISDYIAQIRGTQTI